MITPTPEQTAIVEAARTTTDNLLISAYAGAAKTSTLVMITEAIKGIPILSLAFNKKIAVEMEKRLPSYCSCKTLNSIGHTTWGTAIGKRLTLDFKKTFNLVSEEIKDFDRDERPDFGDVMKAVSRAKAAGYIPDSNGTRGLITEEEFFDSFEEEPDRHFRNLVNRVLLRSIRAAYAGNIDFDDQIYMPTLFGGSFPRFPLVLVDEAQDLSPLNHAMLKKLVTKRLIAVGDPYQSIYGFRGAVQSGMEKLRDTFSMKDMKLSVSFRCPRSIIRRAWSRVPDMRWPEWAVEGSVVDLPTLSYADIEDGAAIICRNNAPLFSLGFRLIANGRGIQLVGADIGPGLVKILRKLGPESMTQEEATIALHKWKTEALRKAKSPGTVEDKEECLAIFIAQGPTLSAAIAYAEHLFKQSGPIQLLSGHKSKGLEWDYVYHLDPWRIPSRFVFSESDMEQELNVRYVIETRAKKTLYLVNAETINE